MTARIITTASSVWTLDETAKEFRRDPRNPDASHPFVSYTGEWTPYARTVDEEFPGGTRTFIYFIEEHPDYGAWLLTGVHEEST